MRLVSYSNAPLSCIITLMDVTGAAGGTQRHLLSRLGGGLKRCQEALLVASWPCSFCSVLPSL